jgi:hypothetical protein
MRVGGERHASAALPPGTTRYLLYRSLGGFQVRSGQVWKISSPPGFDPRTVQPVASRYTDYAIRAHIHTEVKKINDMGSKNRLQNTSRYLLERSGNSALSNRWVFTISVVTLFYSESGWRDVIGQWTQHEMWCVVVMRFLPTSCYWSDKRANRVIGFHLHILHRLFPTHINSTFRKSIGKVQYCKILKVNGQVSCETNDRGCLAFDFMKYVLSVITRI